MFTCRVRRAIDDLATVLLNRQLCSYKRLSFLFLLQVKWIKRYTLIKSMRITNLLIIFFLMKSNFSVEFLRNFKNHTLDMFLWRVQHGCQSRYKRSHNNLSSLSHILNMVARYYAKMIQFCNSVWSWLPNWLFVIILNRIFLLTKTKK